MLITLFILSVIMIPVSLIMIMIVSSVPQTVGWSIALHVSLLIPAGMIWGILTWGTAEVLFSRMALTILPFTGYCAAFITYRSRQKKKAPESIKPGYIDFNS